MKEQQRGVQWDMQERYEDVDSADDICLLSQWYNNTEAKLMKQQNGLD